MSNELKIADLLLEKTLFEFRRINTFLAPGVYNNEYDEYYFAKKNGGYFPGNSLRIRKPNIMETTQGWTVTPQPIVEDYVTLTLQEPINHALQLRSDEMATKLNDEGESWVTRVAKPVAKGLMAKLNRLITLQAETNVWNWVGDSTSDITSTEPFYAAGITLDQLDAQVGSYGTYMAIPPQVYKTFTPEVLSLFTPTINEEVFRKGVIGELANFDFFKAPQLTPHRSSAGIATETPLVRVDMASGDTLVKVKGFTAGFVVKAGDLFTITGAGGNPTPTKLAPIGKENTGQIFQFCASADATADSGGNVDIPVNKEYPLISDTTNPRRNISGIFHTDDVINFVGDYSYAIGWLMPTLTVATPNLPLLNNGAVSTYQEDPDTKVTIRYVAQDNMTLSASGKRFDIWPGIWFDGTMAIKVLCKPPAL